MVSWTQSGQCSMWLDWVTELHVSNLDPFIRMYLMVQQNVSLDNKHAKTLSNIILNPTVTYRSGS